MAAGNSPRSAGARRLVARAGPLVALALGGACVIPPRPLAPPSPEALASTPPAVSVWSPSVFPGTNAVPSLYFSTDRPGYAAVFEADRRGRVRVVFPRTPREDGRVVPGETYTAVSNGVANDRLFLTAATEWRRLPFLFVVVSDARPDLSDFGRGRAWQQQVRTDGVEAEDVVEAVARRVTAASARPYATDFAYLPPRLSAREAFFAASCAVPARDGRDYWYFRDLWAVFTPGDPTLGLTPVFAFGSVVTWASGPYLGVAFDRAQFASAAFRGGCVSPFQPQWGYYNPLLYAVHRAPGTVVATGPGAAPSTPTPPAGAVPVVPRLPKTPREAIDGPTLRPTSDGAAGPSRPGGEGRSGSWLAAGTGGRRPGGVVAEPIERPAGGDMGRRWGTPTGSPVGWTTGRMVGDAGEPADRPAAGRPAPVGREGWDGGPGWGRGLADRPAGAPPEVRSAAPRDPAPAAGGGRGAWGERLGGGRAGGVADGGSTPPPPRAPSGGAGGAAGAGAPAAAGGGARIAGGQGTPR